MHTYTHINNVSKRNFARSLARIVVVRFARVRRLRKGSSSRSDPPDRCQGGQEGGRGPPPSSCESNLPAMTPLRPRLPEAVAAAKPVSLVHGLRGNGDRKPRHPRVAGEPCCCLLVESMLLRTSSSRPRCRPHSADRRSRLTLVHASPESPPGSPSPCRSAHSTPPPPRPRVTTQCRLSRYSFYLASCVFFSSPQSYLYAYIMEGGERGAGGDL